MKKNQCCNLRSITEAISSFTTFSRSQPVHAFAEKLIPIASLHYSTSSRTISDEFGTGDSVDILTIWQNSLPETLTHLQAFVPLWPTELEVVPLVFRSSTSSVPLHSQHLSYWPHMLLQITPWSQVLPLGLKSRYADIFKFHDTTSSRLSSEPQAWTILFKSVSAKSFSLKFRIRLMWTSKVAGIHPCRSLDRYAQENRCLAFKINASLNSTSRMYRIDLWYPNKMNVLTQPLASLFSNETNSLNYIWVTVTYLMKNFHSHPTRHPAMEDVQIMQKDNTLFTLNLVHVHQSTELYLSLTTILFLSRPSWSVCTFQPGPFPLLESASAVKICARGPA